MELCLFIKMDLFAQAFSLSAIDTKEHSIEATFFNIDILKLYPSHACVGFT